MLSHPVESGFPASSSQLVEMIEARRMRILKSSMPILVNYLLPVKRQSKILWWLHVPLMRQYLFILKKGICLRRQKITTAKGGKLVCMSKAKQALIQAGIKKGVSGKALDNLLGQQLELPAGHTVQRHSRPRSTRKRWQ